MTLNEAIELLEDNGYIIAEGPNVAVLKGGIGCGISNSSHDWSHDVHEFVKRGNVYIRDERDQELAKYKHVWLKIRDIIEREPKYYSKQFDIESVDLYDENAVKELLYKMVTHPEYFDQKIGTFRRLKNSFGFKDKMDEDFSIGVGAPCGLDQGIPHGGDCKGCAPVRMGLWQRSPFSANPFYQGVPDAHHPDYWLNQIPKKKKKKKKKIRKLREE